MLTVLISFIGPTLQDIRLEYALEEKERARVEREKQVEEEAGRSHREATPGHSHEEATPGQYIFLLLEVEDQQ